MIPIFTLSLRALARGRRLLVVILLLAVPAALALVYRVSTTQVAFRADGGRFSIQLFEVLVLLILLPLTALIFATSALGGELEDRTLLYLTLKPVSRGAVVAAKLLAAGLVTLVLVEASLAATVLLAAQSANLGAVVLAGVGGCVAYGSLFLLVGLLAPRRGLIVGFVYVIAWEGTLAGLSTGLATLSVRRYVQGALDAGLGASPLASIQPATVNGLTSALVLALVGVAGLILCIARLRRMELP